MGKEIDHKIPDREKQISLLEAIRDKRPVSGHRTLTGVSVIKNQGLRVIDVRRVGEERVVVRHCD